MAKKYNCEKNGISYYRISRTINGKRKEFYGDGEKDAIRQYTEYMKQVSLGFDPELAKRPFDVAFKEWLYTIHKYKIKESSMLTYDGLYNVHISGAPFANKSLSSIRRTDIESYINKKFSTGTSSTMLQHILKLLTAFFTYLVNSDVIPKSPTKGLKAPRDEKKDVKTIEVFTKEEQEKIITASRNTYNGLLFELALATGMRLGELLALEYGDITSDGVWVTKNQVKVRGGSGDITYKITSPKSKTGHRFIPLPPHIFSLVEEHKRAQSRQLGGAITNRVFLRKNGEVISSGTAESFYRVFINSVGVPYKKFHTFRHTYITNCIQAGIDIVTVQELAGHSSIDMTRQYTHISIEHKVREAQKLYSKMPNVGEVWEN